MLDITPTDERIRNVADLRGQAVRFCAVSHPIKVVSDGAPLGAYNRFDDLMFPRAQRVQVLIELKRLVERLEQVVADEAELTEIEARQAAREEAAA